MHDQFAVVLKTFVETKLRHAKIHQSFFFNSVTRCYNKPLPVTKNSPKRSLERL